MLATQILIKPLLTEKSHQLLKQEVYLFIVHPNATKTDVKKAFEIVFGVKVDSVNLLVRKRKPKSLGRYHGFKKAIKKAYIKIAPNQNFNFLKENDDNLSQNDSSKSNEKTNKGWSFFERFRPSAKNTVIDPVSVPKGESKQ